MSKLHSTWLMPQAAHAAELKAIIDDLAAHFGRPRFEPHLTLTEEVRCDAADLARKAAAAADGVRAFEAAIASIDTSPLYFRCLYARLCMPSPLASLRAELVSRLGRKGGDRFTPHVSLLYGVQESAGKSEARGLLSRKLLGRNIRFDRLCIVASAKDIPIEEWRLCVEIGLST